MFGKCSVICPIEITSVLALLATLLPSFLARFAQAAGCLHRPRSPHCAFQLIEYNIVVDADWLGVLINRTVHREPRGAGAFRFKKHS